MLTEDWIYRLAATLLHFLWQGALVWCVFAAGICILKSAAPQARYRFALSCFVLLAIMPVWTIAVVSPVAVSSTGGGLVSEMAGFKIPQSLLYAFLALWLLGVFRQLASLAADWQQVATLRNEKIFELPNEILQIAVSLIANAGLARSVQVFESGLTIAPLTTGWLKPVILIPTAALMALTPGQLELVIAHEISHIRRHDYLINMLQLLIETLFFYHPAVRSISEYIRVQRELCCDHDACADETDARQLAKALYVLEDNRRLAHERIPNAVMAVNGGELLQRVFALLGRPGEFMVTGAWKVTVATFCAPLCLILVMDVIKREAIESPFVSRIEATVLKKAIAPPEFAPSEADTAMVAGAVAYETMSEPPADNSSAMQRIVAAVNPITSADALELPAEDTQSDTGSIDSDPFDTDANYIGPFAATTTVISKSNVVTQSTLDVMHGDLNNVSRKLASMDQYEGGALVSRVLPRYPVGARMRGHGDILTARFTVTEIGDVINIQVRSEGKNYRFKNAVTRAIAQWRYEPMTRNGQTIEHDVEATIHFSLDPRWSPDDMCRVAEHILISCGRKLSI